MSKKPTGLALSGEVDTDKIRTLTDRVDKNSQLIDEIVDKLVADYCKPLDDYMEFVRSIVSDEKHPPTDEELDDFTLNLPVLLYFTGEAQESLGIKEDIAKAIRQELYSNSFSTAVGTVGDKTSIAELSTQSETIVWTTYQRAYKKIKLRMESANEMLQSVKKVISRRMVEYEVSRVDPGRIGGV